MVGICSQNIRLCFNFYRTDLLSLSHVCGNDSLNWGMFVELGYNRIGSNFITADGKHIPSIFSYVPILYCSDMGTHVVYEMSLRKLAKTSEYINEGVIFANTSGVI